jgi:hypothetical protein
MVDNDKIDELIGVEAEVLEELVVPESAAPEVDRPDDDETGAEDEEEAGDGDDDGDTESEE